MCSGNQGGSPQLLRKQLPGPLEGRFDVLHFPVLQGHFQSLQHTPGSNVTTHDTCADHVHAACLEIAAFTLGLEAFHQPENAPESARSTAGDQTRIASSLLLQHLLRLTTMRLPGVDQFKRGRVVHRIGLCGSALSHLACKELTHRGPIAEFRNGPGSAAFAAFEDRPPGSPAQFRMWAHELIHQSQGFRLVSPSHASCQHQLQRLESPNLPGTAHAAAESRIDSQAYFGKTQPGSIGIFGNAVIKTQGQFQAATETVTVDDDGGWKFQGLDPIEQVVDFTYKAGCLFDIFHLVELSNVGADDERTFFARLQHQARRWFSLKESDNLLQFVEHFFGKTVGGLSVPVQRQPADLVHVEFQTPVPVV